MERTKQFGKEVVDLLRHQPHCRMAFSKFIPTYHHHFGRQCKLSYYGFTKLMELFEAIPNIVMVSWKRCLYCTALRQPPTMRNSRVFLLSDHVLGVHVVQPKQMIARSRMKSLDVDCC